MRSGQRLVRRFEQRQQLVAVRRVDGHADTGLRVHHLDAGVDRPGQRRGDLGRDTLGLVGLVAGLAGGLLLANQSLSPSLASAFVIQAFGVIIVGGMGSISGAFLGAILLGLIDAVGQWMLPGLPGLPFFLALTAILLLRPQGLMGRAS